MIGIILLQTISVEQYTQLAEYGIAFTILFVVLVTFTTGMVFGFRTVRLLNDAREKEIAVRESHLSTLASIRLGLEKNTNRMEDYDNNAASRFEALLERDRALMKEIMGVHEDLKEGRMVYSEQIQLINNKLDQIKEVLDQHCCDSTDQLVETASQLESIVETLRKIGKDLENASINSVGTVPDSGGDSGGDSPVASSQDPPNSETGLGRSGSEDQSGMAGRDDRSPDSKSI